LLWRSWYLAFCSLSLCCCEACLSGTVFVAAWNKPTGISFGHWFNKIFIKPYFICRGDIRTYHDLPVEYAEILNTVHSRNIQVSCGRMLLFIVICCSTQRGCPINIKTTALSNRVDKNHDFFFK